MKKKENHGENLHDSYIPFFLQPETMLLSKGRMEWHGMIAQTSVIVAQPCAYRMVQVYRYINGEVIV